MSELKPCPFCGSSDIELVMRMSSEKARNGDFVRCKACGAETSQAAWNTRAKEDEGYPA